MPEALPLLTVDVFTDVPFLGNPVAVVLDADRLSDATMQRIAHWTNLSETTFVVGATDPQADYRLRIFTPERELPFAGHPTLGSAAAVIAARRVVPRAGRLVQQCGAGLVPIRADASGARLHFEVPRARVAPVSVADRTALAAALGLPATAPVIEAIDVGPVWLTAELADAGVLRALRPDLAALETLTRRLGATGVTLHADQAVGSATDVAVRSFAPAAGVPEDPVCGSGNACVAVQRRAGGRRADYVAAQGEAVGRDGRISVGYRGDAIEIGGSTVICVEGRIAAG
jgi:PhzF family phenazine biosynthesis protein